ncbi:hypothetical protein [Rhodoblastus sp.]|uniref:hypothetical protein n=1 Tax=Rhodoblastus sp. TaxID=1962975 RepID=UPI003F9B35E2
MRSKKSDLHFPSLHLAETPSTEDPVDARKSMLKELTERLDQHNVFFKGQFVRWKPGLKNRKFPEYGEPAIVTGVLPTPILDPAEATASSPYFQEPLNLVIGVFQDEDLLEFRVDGRRFEPLDD